MLLQPGKLYRMVEPDSYRNPPGLVISVVGQSGLQTIKHNTIVMFISYPSPTKYYSKVLWKGKIGLVITNLLKEMEK